MRSIPLPSRLVVLCVLLLSVSAAHAQGTRLLRDPAISETHVAFVYAGDIWIAPRDGGEARRLTTYVGYESAPHFSPAGAFLAFTGEYEGNGDAYIVPVSGGEPTRVTYHPNNDIVNGWTADGKRLLIASARGTIPYPTRRLWTVPVTGGWPELLPMDKAEKGCFSPDGSKMAYVPWGEPTSTWRGYRGGQTTPVWIIDLTDLSVTEIPRNNSNDQDPMWIGESVYFLSDRNGTQNLFRYDPDGSVTQLTHHRDYDVKRASSCGDTIVYEQAGYLHLFSRT